MPCDAQDEESRIRRGAHLGFECRMAWETEYEAAKGKKGKGKRSKSKEKSKGKSTL